MFTCDLAKEAAVQGGSAVEARPLESRTEGDLSVIILSLCDRTGVMVQPWLEAGYECWIVDVQHKSGMHQMPHKACDNPKYCRCGKLHAIGADVGGFELPPRELAPVAIAFAFPPCTNLAVSGARWFKDKGLEALHESLGLVVACKRICEASGAPWMLENPVGTLSSYWRKPDYTFQPWQYGDRYTKKTCLWTGSGFVMPPAWHTTPPDGTAPTIHLMPPSADRGDKRSITPEGFARAVFEVNEPKVRAQSVDAVGKPSVTTHRTSTRDYKSFSINWISATSRAGAQMTDTECTCGAEDPTSARHGHSHLAWCRSKWFDASRGSPCAVDGCRIPGSDTHSPVEATPGGGAPPRHIVDFAVEVSRWSPCRSKRGVVVFSGADVVTHGYNYKPRGFDCTQDAACKATCRREAIHAEQQALMLAGRRAEGSDMLHVKTVNGALVTSGGPSCVECSKLARAAGIAGVWLFHESGWRRYTAEEFHRLSLEATPTAPPAALEDDPSPLLLHAIRAEAERARRCGAVITADLLEAEANNLQGEAAPPAAQEGLWAAAERLSAASLATKGPLPDDLQAALEQFHTALAALRTRGDD